MQVWKMTPEEIARELLEQLQTFCIDREGEISNKECAIEIIAKALRGYGETECKHGLACSRIYSESYVDMKKVDAEGYRRGVEEAADTLRNHCVYYKGLNISCGHCSSCERADEIIVTLQRGAGGGE